MRVIALFAFCAVLLVLAAGCGSDKIAVYPVQGKVTFEGKPLPGGGSISFIPIKSQPGKTAAGEIGADGNYRLTTHSHGDGSMTGEFRVVINQIVDREPEASTDGGKVAKATSLPMSDRIPPIYADHANSPLTATVEAKSPNELNFDIKRK